MKFIIARGRVGGGRTDEYNRSRGQRDLQRNAKKN